MLRRLTFVPCAEQIEHHYNPTLFHSVAWEPHVCCCHGQRATIFTRENHKVCLKPGEVNPICTDL